MSVQSADHTITCSPVKPVGFSSGPAEVGREGVHLNFALPGVGSGHSEKRRKPKQKRPMKIKKILSQHRRDFTATLECEHCGHEQHLSSGYDDDHYHRNVIPNLPCGACGEKSPSGYRPLQPRHGAHEVV